MDKSEEEIVKVLVQEFILLLSQNKIKELSQKFDISKVVFEEIIEVLDGYGLLADELQPIDFDKSFVSDIFQMNDHLSIGVEVNIWARGRYQEPVLHAEVSFKNEKPVFNFQYIGS